MAVINTELSYMHIFHAVVRLGLPVAADDVTTFHSLTIEIFDTLIPYMASIL
jgi:hypothetical protein